MINVIDLTILVPPQIYWYCLEISEKFENYRQMG